MKDDPMAIFQKEAPEVAKAFDGLIQSLIASKEPDEKTKQLINLYRHEAAQADDTAVNFHVPMAKRRGQQKKK